MFALLLADDLDVGTDDAISTATVTSLRLLVRDGWYNAFTDLVQWKNYFWLAYRRGTYHNQVTGNTVSAVLRSNDLRLWHEAKVFEPPDGVADESRAHRGCFVPVMDRLCLFFPVQTPAERGLFGRVYVTV